MADQARAPLKVGLHVSSIVGGMRDGALRWKDLLATAQRAETVGFDSFWLPDHLLFRFAGEPAHGPWECWSMLAGVAAATSRIEIGTLVACTGYRNPTLLAKMADTVDEISGGRLTLGLGAGWHEPEYRAYGYPFDHRLERFEEAVQVIRTLLRDGQIDHTGRFYEARHCELRPRGPRPQGPPILIGTLASGPRMARLIASHADIWNGSLTHARGYADQVPARRAVIDAACAAVGRDPATLQRTIDIQVDQWQSDQGERGYPVATPLREGQHQPLRGTPEAIAAELRRFAHEGIAHIQVAPVIDGVAGVEAMAPVLDLLRRG